MDLWKKIFFAQWFFFQIYPKSFFPNLLFFAPSKRRLQSLYLTVLRLLWLQYDMIKEFPWHQEAKFAMHIICDILKFTQEYCISHKAWNSFCGILKFTKKYCISHEKWKQRERKSLTRKRTFLKIFKIEKTNLSQKTKRERKCNGWFLLIFSMDLHWESPEEYLHKF